MKPDNRTQQHDHDSENVDDSHNDDERSGIDDEATEINPDDPRWDAFLADDDELDPEPEYGDFWPEDL